MTPDDLTAAVLPACRHAWGWRSPAGSHHSARLCGLCGTPDPEWLDAQAAEVDRLRAELARLTHAYATVAWAEDLFYQDCPAGKHPDYGVPDEHSHQCPWCHVEAAEARMAAQAPVIAAARNALDYGYASHATAEITTALRALDDGRA